MIFDVHVHIQPWEMLSPGARALMDDVANRGVIDLISNADALLRHLDAEGIERICCINYVSPRVMGFNRGANDWIARFTAQHRDRLFPVGSVDASTEKDVRSEIRRVLDLGIRLVKIHPPHQWFSPNAYRHELPDLADLYTECQTRRVPVMFHTGTSIFPNARNVYADPMPIDDVAIDFPELRIILAHCGRPLYGDTAYFLARRHPNVFVDLSGIPPAALLRYVPRLSEIADKALWGTDWPSPGVVSMAGNVEQFRGLGLGQEVEQAILWNNAVKIFGE